MMKIDSLESDVLKHGLLIGICFQIYQSVFSIYNHVNLETLGTNLAILSLLCFLLFLARRGMIKLPSFLLHTATLGAFIFFWGHYGGMAGTVPGFICIYLIFVIIVSRSYLLLAYVISLIAILTIFFTLPELLGMSSIEEPHKINLIQHAIDFVIVAATIAIFTVYLKKRFMKYRHESEQTNEKLNSVEVQLRKSNNELFFNKNEILRINENLMKIVQDKVVDLEQHNNKLEELAFINAHKLRGPLCRVIGMLNLMEKEGHSVDSARLKYMRDLAAQIDQSIRKISEVTEE